MNIYNPPTNLSPAQAAYLLRMQQAYKTHERVPSRKELLARNAKPLSPESCMEVVREQFANQSDWID